MWEAYFPPLPLKARGVAESAGFQGASSSLVFSLSETHTIRLYMATYNRQVIDIKAAAGMTGDQSNEHQRRWTERGWKDAAKHGNYDPTRARLNFEVTKGGVVRPIDTSVSIPKRIKATLAERGIADPNEEMKRKRKEPNRRTVVNIIFGGSRERMHQIAFGDQKVDLTHGADNSHIEHTPEIEEWARDIYAFACGKWGEENIVGFYVHLDEMNPHIHCTVLPITARNKFSFKELFAGKDKAEFTERTRKLHDDLAVVNARWGLGRGNDKLETGARHRTTEEYRRELRRECNELELQRTDLELEISDRHETLRDLYADIRKAEKRCKGLTTMVRNLEQKETELTSQLAQLEADLESGNGNAADLCRRIADLEGRLRTTASSLADKKQKLKQADRQLAQLNDEMSSVKERTENLKKERDEFSADVQSQIRMRLTDAVFGKTFVEFGKLIDNLSPQQKEAFGNDFLVHLAEKPAEILQCAMYLFAGYVDGAIQFAKSSGGGSTSDLKWGRDPKEDERRFAFRCMVQAHRMMKSSQQVKRK